MSVVEKAVAKLKSAAQETPDRTAPHEIPSVPVVQSPKSRQPRPPVDPMSVFAITHDVLVAAGMAPERGQERRIAEEFRSVKRSLLNHVRELQGAQASGAQLLMVASALPGDGKTFSSFHLAQTMARERDVSVLLVDADVAKPNLTRAFQMADKPGLLDALSDESLDIESCVIPTNIDGLSLLPAGRKGSDAAVELLASDRMAQIVERLSRADPHRVVVLDSPPLLLSSESRLIVHTVGQVVLVVLAGVTPQGAVRDAIASIPPDKMAGLLINQREKYASAKQYGFDGYYGYENGGEQGGAHGA